jgi:uncharacterized protein
MVATGSLNTEVSLERLDAFLLSDRVPANCMGLSDLDGFLTGIVLGPELILPSEWLPVIWGTDEPDFASTEEALAILGTIMSRYIEIVTNLDADPRRFDPVFWQRQGGEIVVEDWAAGFLDAIRLRVTAWEPLVLHPDARALIAPFLLLGSEREDRPPLAGFPSSPAYIQRLSTRAVEIIPKCVVEIHAFWRDHGTGQLSQEARGKRRT